MKRTRGRRRQEELLQRIEEGAKACLELERKLGEHPPPELETLIRLHRQLVLEFCLEAAKQPDRLKLVKDLMKPIMDWAQLRERQKLRELAELKYRDQVEARKAALKQTAAQGLPREMLNDIEQQLRLL